MRPETVNVRIDKWLWAARFFKTRGLAKKALLNGRIEINGVRAKPSRTLNGGELVKIQKGDEIFVVLVCLVSERRGPATVAATLYSETAASLAAREVKREMRKTRREDAARAGGKPDKKQRRRLQNLKRSQ